MVAKLPEQPVPRPSSGQVSGDVSDFLFITRLHLHLHAFVLDGVHCKVQDFFPF